MQRPPSGETGVTAYPTRLHARVLRIVRDVEEDISEHLVSDYLGESPASERTVTGEFLGRLVASINALPPCDGWKVSLSRLYVDEAGDESEDKYGADYFLVLKMTGQAPKGVGVQAKYDDGSGQSRRPVVKGTKVSFTASSLRDLAIQVSKMLVVSDEAYVVVYHRNGFRVVSGFEVASRVAPFEAPSITFGSFFELFLKTFVGDENIAVQSTSQLALKEANRREASQVYLLEFSTDD